MACLYRKYRCIIQFPLELSHSSDFYAHLAIQARAPINIPEKGEGKGETGTDIGYCFELAA